MEDVSLKNQLLEKLLFATESKSKDDFAKRMENAGDFSKGYNFHEKKIAMAVNLCDFDNAKGFFYNILLIV